jgi:hypothetical protein
VTLQTWGAALVITAASLLFGHALSVLGFGRRAVAPATGLSSLIVLCGIAVKLPGKATTSALVVLLVALAAAALSVVRRGRIRFPGLAVTVGVIAAFGAAIPFIANGRVGLLGVSLDNDTAAHLIYAEALRSPVTRHQYGLPGGYPLGPHSLAVTLSSGLGIRLDLVFTGLGIAIVILTALVAAAAFCEESAWKRVVGGTFAALLYLVAAYYAEGAFKEPLMGVLLLAMVLALEQLRRRWAAGSPGRWRQLVTVSLLVAAGIYTYSYLALAWFGLTIAIWLAAEVATHPAWIRQWRSQLSDVLWPVAIAVGILLVLLVPIAGQISLFANTVGVSPAATGAITTSNLGNLAHALSAYEALGLWTSYDFRLFPGNIFHAGEISAFALGVLLLGLAWSLARREFLLPAAIAACAIIYWRSSLGQSPYVTAKALVIPGPVIAVTTLRGLLRSTDVPVEWWVRLSRLALAAVFVTLAGYSSYVTLRDEPVWPAESTQELLGLDRVTRGHTVLFLGNSDYATWLFHDSKLSALASNTRSLAQAAPRSNKPPVYGTALDFDSVDPASLDRFRWVVTSNTSYASQVPQNFRLVRRLLMYELWERTGPTVPRQTIEPSGAPGAVLDCRTKAGRELSREHGMASVLSPPVVIRLSGIAPGGTERVPLALGPGTWNLSLQYVSAVGLELSTGQNRWQMPAYLDRPGPLFSIGSVSSGGTPMTVTIRADRPSPITGPNLVAQTTEVVATRTPNVLRLISLHRSCGRYVDWYRPS